MAAKNSVIVAVVFLGLGIIGVLLSQGVIHIGVGTSLVTVVAENDQFPFTTVAGITVTATTQGYASVSGTTTSSWSTEPQLPMYPNTNYTITANWNTDELTVNLITPSFNGTGSFVLYVMVNYIGTIDSISFSPPIGPYNLQP